MFFFLLFFGAMPKVFAASMHDLERSIAVEQKKAAERKASLERLTKQERELNTDLAAAEKRILQIESTLDDHQSRLTELARDDTTLTKEYDALIAEQAKTEEAQTETMNLLWAVVCKRQSVGGREMADWAPTDRDYAWSKELYAALEKYRKKLGEQSAQLEKLMGRREKLSTETHKRLTSVEHEKKELLSARLSYSQRLAAIRKEKAGTESELEAVLRLVESLNFQLEQVSSRIENMKGRLPWPVAGQMRQHYGASTSAASRGVGFSASEGQEVRAVAAGRVVHSDVLRGFGTVLIIQHGSEYYTLYAFLGSTPLKAGEDVTARARIGSAGYYPAVNGPGLYFELRFRQKAINPEQWLAPS